MIGGEFGWVSVLFVFEGSVDSGCSGAFRVSSSLVEVNGHFRFLILFGAAGEEPS